MGQSSQQNAHSLVVNWLLKVATTQTHAAAHGAHLQSRVRLAFRKSLRDKGENVPNADSLYR